MSHAEREKILQGFCLDLQVTHCISVGDIPFYISSTCFECYSYRVERPRHKVVCVLDASGDETPTESSTTSLNASGQV